eukprot:SAG11_NODE_3227_length_2596_cov_8.763316_4_plen_193_part_00
MAEPPLQMHVGAGEPFERVADRNVHDAQAEIAASADGGVHRCPRVSGSLSVRRKRVAQRGAQIVASDHEAPHRAGDVAVEEPRHPRRATKVRCGRYRLSGYQAEAASTQRQLQLQAREPNELVRVAVALPALVRVWGLGVQVKQVTRAKEGVRPTEDAEVVCRGGEGNPGRHRPPKEVRDAWLRAEAQEQRR